MLLQDQGAEHSSQKTRHRLRSHATRTPKPCTQRLSSRTLSTKPCSHISTQRGMDPEQQSSTRQSTSRLEWTACASTRHLSQFLPKDALDHFSFAFRRLRCLRHHWRGWLTRDRHFLHKPLRRGLGQEWEYSSHPPLNLPRDRGLRVCGDNRLWKVDMVPFTKARELGKGSNSNQKS